MAQAIDFGMAGGVVGLHRAIMAGGDHRAICHQHGADGQAAGIERFLRLFEPHAA
ncbi:MAG: hypothetical protein WD044_05920 [Dongiaceae bacterium]